MAKPKLALIPASQGSKVFSVLPSSGVGDFDFSRSGKATRINSQGLIEEVANGVSRLNYPMIDGKVVGCPSHLLEPQRTNSITYSNDFSQSIYGKINLTITANQGISPDGTQNANLLVPNAAVGNRYLTNSTGSNLKINTVFLKKKELRYVKVGNAQSNVLVDLENGTISADSVSTNNFTIENYGNGWYRVSCYNTLDVNLQIQIFIGIDGSGSNIATNGTDGVYIYGFEIQNGSYPTSYIPTNGSAVTRSAETANGSGDASTFNDSEGVLMAEISSQNDSSTKLISLASTSGSENTVWIGYANGVYSVIRSNGVTTVETNIIPTQSNEVIKCAILYSNSNVKFYINGFNLFEDINISMPIGLDQLRFSRKGGSLPFYGNTKQLQYYNSALTDSELEILTSWVSFTEMAQGQLYTIE